MEQVKANKTRIILSRAVRLLALPVALSALTWMVNVQSGAKLLASDREFALEQMSMAEQVVQSDWGTAHPAVYSRITAMAFDTEALDGADLMRVECRSTLCKVVYEADSDIKISRILPRQIADSFNSMVTVHAGSIHDHETLVYIDIPSST